jgi:hypothetical protein
MIDNSAAGISLQGLARALGGEVSGGQVLAPGPGHSPADLCEHETFSPSEL